MTMPVSVRKVDGGKIKGPASVPNVVEIACVMTIPNGKTTHVVLHGRYVTPPANMQTLANAMFTAISGAWSSNLAAYMHANTSFIRVQVRDMASFLNPVFIGTGTAATGTSASPASPPQNAIVLTENVIQRGRGLKGRMYWPGWATNADAGSGSILPLVQTALNAFGTALQSALTANGLTSCVAQVQRQAYVGLAGTQHPARAAAPVNVTSYTCQDLLWDTQRRRGL